MAGRTYTYYVSAQYVEGLEVNESASDTVTVDVSAPNVPPVATAQAVSTDEDLALLITLAGIDANDDTLTFAIVSGSGPANGSLSGAPPNLTYTPHANFHGADSFAFTANDGTVDSAPATVTITVDSVNDVPIASDNVLTTDEDVAGVVVVTATDVDGDPLSFAVAGGPANGVVANDGGGAFTYTPNGDFNGSDSFTVVANDGTVDSAPATVAVTVDPVNDVPIASDNALSTDEDVAGVVVVTATDIDGDPLSFAVASGPANGVVANDGGGAFTYTPNGDFNGSDSFTVVANDGTVDSAPATVAVTVDPVNDVPIASDNALSTDEDVAGVVVVTATDIDGDPLSFAVASGPANGVVANDGGGAFTYTPNGDFNGSDSFTVVANDGTVDSGPATVTITVDPVNDVPIASDNALSTDEDVAGVVVVTAMDVDGDPLSFAVASGPANGVVANDGGGAFTYTPNGDFNGSDSFTVVANDGTVDSAPATVAVTVDPVNDVPIASDNALSTDEDVAGVVVVTATDIDGDPLSFAVASGPANGVVANDGGGAFTYTPNGDVNGSDSFTVVANDGTVDSAPATVAVTVDPVNDAPVADAGAATLAEDTAVAIVLTGSDVDGDALTFAVVTGATNGALSGTPPNVIYAPNPNFYGADSFTFTVADASVTSAAATVSIVVIPVNDPPVALDDSYETDQGAPLVVVVENPDGTPGVLGNDTDVDDLSLTAVRVSEPSNGTLVLNADGSFTYTPGPSFNGEDSFTYAADDSSQLSIAATVSITVHATTAFLVIDDEGIGSGTSPNFFSDTDVNADIAEIGVRTPLRFFANNVGTTITLPSGGVGDEGWFALETVPSSWESAGPTADGLRNFAGNPSVAIPHNVGPGLAARGRRADS